MIQKTLEVVSFDHRRSIDDGMEREDRVRDDIDRFIYCGFRDNDGDETTVCK